MKRSMAMNFEALAEALAEYKLDPSQVIRDTHMNTVVRVVALLDECIKLTLSMKLLVNGEAVTKRMFAHKGKLATLEKKIRKAHDLGMLDGIANKDAHLLRKIRNQFAHTRDALHFDAPSIVARISQLSTYAASETNQAAFLAAVDGVEAQLRKAVDAKSR